MSPPLCLYMILAFSQKRHGLQMSQRIPTWGPYRSSLWILSPSTKSVSVNPQAAWFHPSEKRRTSAEPENRADTWTPRLSPSCVGVGLGLGISSHLQNINHHLTLDEIQTASLIHRCRKLIVQAVTHEIFIKTIIVKCRSHSAISLHSYSLVVTRLHDFFCSTLGNEGHLKRRAM